MWSQVPATGSDSIAPTRRQRTKKRETVIRPSPFMFKAPLSKMDCTPVLAQSIKNWARWGQPDPLFRCEVWLMDCKTAVLGAQIFCFGTERSRVSPSTERRRQPGHMIKIPGEQCSGGLSDLFWYQVPLSGSFLWSTAGRTADKRARPTARYIKTVRPSRCRVRAPPALAASGQGRWSRP